MMSQSAWVFDVSEAEFEEKVVQRSQEAAVVVDFWAPWCGPCRSLGPVLERMVEERKGAVLLAKVNTDEAQNLAVQFGITGIPHVVGFRKGRPVVQFTGLLPQAQLDEFFSRLAPSEAEIALENAAKIETSNPTEAERTYRLVLQSEPNLEEAILGLARVLIRRKELQEASDMLDRASPHGERGPEVEKLRAMIWLCEQAKDLPAEEALRAKVNAEPKNAPALCDLGIVQAANAKTTEALETLLQAGRLDRALASTRVKEAMVKTFFIIGVRSELADAYRDKLTKLLY